jgi:hypothetical protein
MKGEARCREYDQGKIRFSFVTGERLGRALGTSHRIPSAQ